MSPGLKKKSYWIIEECGAEVVSQLPKKILYIGNFQYPDKNAAATRSKGLSEVMTLAGATVIKIGIDKAVCKDSESFLKKIDDETYCVSCGDSLKEWIKYSLNLRKVFACFSSPERIDVVVGYNMSFLSQVMLFVLSKKNKNKLVFDITEKFDYLRPTNIRAIIKNTDIYLSHRLAPVLGGGCIVVSPALKRGLGLCKKTILIPTIMPSCSIEPAQQGKNEVYRNSPHPIKFHFAGSGFGSNHKAGTKHKDRIDICIVVFELFASKEVEFEANIFGIERDDYLAHYPEHTGFLNSNREKVLFHGWVDRRLTLESLAKSDFSIFFRDEKTSTNNGFPTKYSESMKYGIPVITNLLEPLFDYAKDGVDGFYIQINNTESYKKLLSIFTMNDKEIDVMKKFCEERDDLSPKTYVDDFRLFLEKI